MTVVAAGALVFGVVSLAAAFGSAGLAVGSYSANALTNYTISSSTSSQEALSRIDVTFPSGVDLSRVTAADITTNWTTTKVVSIADRQVSVVFGTPRAQNRTVQIGIGDVRNPSHPGPYTVSGTYFSGGSPSPFGPIALPSPIVANRTAVGSVTCTPGSTTQGASTTYTVGFTTGSQGRLTGTAASGADTITVGFPAGTSMPALPSSADVSINGMTPDRVACDRSDRTVTLTLPWSLDIPGGTEVNVAFAKGFGLENPSATGAVRVDVSTSVEVERASSAPYTITQTPTRLAVTSFQQPAGEFVAPGRYYAVDGFTIRRTGGAAEVSVVGVSIENTGTKPASTVSDVFVYADDGDGVPELGGADDLLNDLASHFSGSTAVVPFGIPHGVGAAAARFWVAYRVSPGAGDSAIVSSRIVAISSDADEVDISTTGAPARAVDCSPPTVSFLDPVSDGALFTQGTKNIAGVAGDEGSGVDSVKVQVRRDSDGMWWNGNTWGAAESVLDASGTEIWSWLWRFEPAEQDGKETYTFSAYAKDKAGNIGSIGQRLGLGVDNVAPRLVRAAPVDSTHLDVAFSEKIGGGEVFPARFTLAGLTIFAADVRSDGSTVRLTTSVQDPGRSYSVHATGLSDRSGNPLAEKDPAEFVGFGVKLSAASVALPDGGFVPPGRLRAVYALDVARTGGTGPVSLSSLTVEAGGSAPASTVVGVYVYLDDGDGIPQSAGPDQSLTPLAGTVSGDRAKVDFDTPLVIEDSTPRRLWIFYRFAPGAPDGAQAFAQVTEVGSDAQVVEGARTRGARFVVDTSAPTVSMIDPAVDGSFLRGDSCAITGEAFDRGSGVATVTVEVRRRSDGAWWGGSAWSSSPAAVEATGTSIWSHVWRFDPVEQNGTETYTIGVRAVDKLGQVSTDVQRTGIVVDNQAPTVSSVASPDPHTVVVTFSEPLTSRKTEKSRFALEPTALVEEAVRVGDRTVRLKTTLLEDGGSYRLQCADEAVVDRAGNPNTAAEVSLQAFKAPRLLLESLEERPTGTRVLRGQTIVVDGFIVRRTSGEAPVSVSSVTVHDSGFSPASSVSDVKLYWDDGDGVAELGGSIGPLTLSHGVRPLGIDGDRLVASERATFVGSDAVLRFTEPVQVASSPQRYWVAYTFAPSAPDGVVHDCQMVGADAGSAIVEANTSPSDPVTVDVLGPTLSSASSVDSYTVDIVLSEAADTSTVDPADFTIEPTLAVTAAVAETDGRTIHLRTQAQLGGLPYTISVGNDSIHDLVGNGSQAPNSARFTGYIVNNGVDARRPSAPATVTAETGTAEPDIATVRWEASTDDIAVLEYQVFRSVVRNGRYESIDSTIGLSFVDRDGIPGQSYYYKVAAVDPSGNHSKMSRASDPVSSAWTVAPHVVFGAGDMCRVCHSMHDAVGPKFLFRDTGDVTQNTSSVCFTCHDGVGSRYDVKGGRDDSFALQSGHSMENTADAGADLTNTCTSCHSPHMDSKRNPGLPSKRVGRKQVAENDAPQMCVGCHDDAQRWYVQKYEKDYPALTSPVRDGTGYPVLGTFPGPIVALDPSSNPHASIEDTGFVRGDCRFCHAAHRGPNRYDGLVATFTAPTPETLDMDKTTGEYATLCFRCHSGGSWEASGAVDIKRYVVSGSAGAGHRIRTEGGLQPAGSPLPCFACHNGHGSSRGNRYDLSDTLGAGLDTATDARGFCLTCHTTTEGKGWDSVSGTYVQVGSGAMVLGLRRDGGDTGLEDFLRLRVSPGHETSSTESCESDDCHGADYSGGGNNVHDPARSTP